jgi:hypothetical protein
VLAVAPGPVLDALATRTEAVCLRVRLAWELHFGARKTDQEEML